MDNDDLAGHELVEKGHSAGPSGGPAVKEGLFNKKERGVPV